MHRWLRRRKSDSPYKVVYDWEVDDGAPEWSGEPAIAARPAQSYASQRDDVPQVAKTTPPYPPEQSRHDPVGNRPLWSRSSAPPNVLVGPLSLAAKTVAEMKRASANFGDVVVFAPGPQPLEPGWIQVDAPANMVFAAMRYTNPAPVLVIGVGTSVEPWLKPLMVSLREAGVGSVRYLAQGSPSDKELKTWAEALGWPSSLAIVPTDADAQRGESADDLVPVRVSPGDQRRHASGEEGYPELGK